MNSRYQSIAQSARGEFKEKNSKFLSYAFPVLTEQEIKSALQTVQKEHPKARNICYAYRLGLDNLVFRANDANEPSGTAGKPILAQIDSFGLKYILIVVVRYFGGTKLGVPGLIHAYKTSSQFALQNSQLIEKTVQKYFRLEAGYDLLNELMSFMKNQKVNLISTNFENGCIIDFSFDADLTIDEQLKKFNGIKLTHLKTL